MDYFELEKMLVADGDKIAFCDLESNVIRTEKGRLYIRSVYGSVFEGGAWRKKYGWARR